MLMTTSLAEQVESTICRHVPPLAAQLGDDAVWPRYDGYSIANLPATFAAILGAQMPGLPSLPADLWRDLAPDVRRVVFVLMDALGYRRFRRALEADTGSGWRPLVERGRLFPLTSVFPSTTVAALSSLWTGLAPSQHGYLGTRLFLREYGVVAQMISLKPAVKGTSDQLVSMGLEPEKFLPGPNVVEVLKPKGVVVYDLMPYPLMRGGLTRILHRGLDKDGLVPFVAASDMWVRLRRLLESAGDQPMYIYAYHAPPDSVSHFYGPSDEPLDAELRSFVYSMQTEFLDRLSPQAARGTLLVISADHGQITTPKPSAIALHQQPMWQDLVMMPTAEARVAYAYVRAGRMQAVRDALARDLPGKLIAVETQEALDAGLWGPGPLHPETLSRVGNLLLLAAGDGYLADPTGQMPEFLGMHGGLTPEEMLVPSLWLRLDG